MTRAELQRVLDLPADSGRRMFELMERMNAGQTPHPATVETALREMRDSATEALGELEPVIPLRPYLTALRVAIRELRAADVPEADRERAVHLADAVEVALFDADRVG